MGGFLTGGSQNLKPLSSWVVASSGKLATLLLSEATISNHCPHGWLLIASSNPLVSSATTSNHCPHGWLLILVIASSNRWFPVPPPQISPHGWLLIVIASFNPLVSSATTSNHCPHGWLLIASSNPLVSSATTSNQSSWVVANSKFQSVGFQCHHFKSLSTWVVTGHLHTHTHIPLCWFLAPQAPNKQESVSLTLACLSLFHASDPLETDKVLYSMRDVHGTVQHD